MLSKIRPPTPDDDIIDLKYDQNVHDTIDMACCFWLFGAISVKFDKINKKSGSFIKTSYYKCSFITFTRDICIFLSISADILQKNFADQVKLSEFTRRRVVK